MCASLSLSNSHPKGSLQKRSSWLGVARTLLTGLLWQCAGETVEGVEAKEEVMEQEDSADQEDQKTGKANDNWAMLSHMKEEDVGITEYISQHKGVSGVIKQR